MNLTKEQSDKYIEILKNGNMDDMFDFGVSVSLKRVMTHIKKITGEMRTSETDKILASLDKLTDK